MRISIKKDTDGSWRVTQGDKVLLSGVSNAKAWSFADRLTGEQISRAEYTTDWSVKKQASGE